MALGATLRHSTPVDAEGREEEEEGRGRDGLQALHAAPRGLIRGRRTWPWHYSSSGLTSWRHFKNKDIVK